MKNQNLKGLNALRALAAMIVVVGHIELMKRDNGITNLIGNRFLPDGHLSVILFFCLSGFLITFLLQKEFNKFGSISFKNFYMRRILRIWPVYFIVIAISFAFFGQNISAATIALCCSIFPNIAHGLNIGWTPSPQIWSIGVEEQFYLIWPLVFSFVRGRFIKLILVLFFISYAILPHFLMFLNSKYFGIDEFSHFIEKFFYGSKYSSMALGCLFGIIFSESSKYPKFINFTESKFSIFIVVISFLFWFTGIRIPYFTDELYSVLFSLTIFIIVTNPFIYLDFKWVDFLGRISYGIYMYHWIVLLLFFKILNKSDLLVFNMYLYTGVICVTIFISWISYKTIETFFNSKKSKFQH